MEAWFALMFGGYFVGRLALEMAKSKEGTVEGTGAGIAVYVCIVAILYGMVAIMGSNYRPGEMMGGPGETVITPPPVDMSPMERTKRILENPPQRGIGPVDPPQ